MSTNSFCPPLSVSLYDRQRLASATAFLPDLWQKIPDWPQVGHQRRVVVIGGGISGLCVAWGLRRAGFSPILLERTPRVGGRIHTLRDHFDDQYVELGATRIPENHPLSMAYIRHFDLPVIEYPSDNRRQIYSVLGRRFASHHLGRTDDPLDLGLTAEESPLDADGLHQHYTNQALRLLSDPNAPNWPSASDIQVFKGQSFLRSLERFGLSNAAMEICLAQAGSIIRIFDALGWLAAQRIDGETQKLYAIRGGNDRLTTSFAAMLGDCIIAEAHVQAVVSESNGVRVDYVRKGERASLRGDYVVCCIPHRLLLEMEFHPRLSEAKLAAIQAVPMGQVTRLNYQFSRRFWNLDDQIRGLHVANTTGPIE